LVAGRAYSAPAAGGVRFTVSSDHVFNDFGTFSFSKSQQDRFKGGELWQEWATRYPELFDEKDVDLAKSQGPRGYHFYEWLAAVIIFNSTGYLSLVEKYETPSHLRKFKIFSSMVGPDLLQLVLDYETFGGTQCPDLFVYSPTGNDWFFCEVKGQGDRLRPIQKEYFTELSRISQRPINVVKLRSARVEKT
jgi:hypothetical protein